MQHDDQLDHLKKQSQDKPLSRRDFMRTLTIAGAAPGLMTAALTGVSLTSSQRSEAAEMLVGAMGKLPKVKNGDRLKDTAGKPMMITPVCICQDWNRELFAPALEMGMNFIHKAGYWNNVPEEFKKLPRESYFTDITVDNTSPGQNPDNYDQAYGQVIDSLNKNGLKYYDVYRAHYGWHSVDDFKKDGKSFNTSYKAFQRLKKEGKVRFFGVSQHPEGGYPAYEEIIPVLIESGIIDTMQVWFSYENPKTWNEVFAKASKAGIGLTAMKINARGRGKMGRDAQRQEELKAPGMVGRALLRDVMTAKRPDGKPIFHTCVTALGNMQTFEENVGAISPKVASLDGFTALQTLFA